MYTFFSKLKQYRQLFFSVLFFAVFSFVVTTFAAPYAPGVMLSPTCVPGSGPDCTVAPIAIGSTIYNSTSMTGSVLFAGASNVLAEDNANLFWNDTTNRLGIGTTTPATALDVAGTVSATGILSSGNVGIGNASPSYSLDVGSQTHNVGYVGSGSGSDFHVTGTYTGATNTTYTITVDCGNDGFCSPNTITVVKDGTTVLNGYGMDSWVAPISLGNDGIYFVFDEDGTNYSSHNTGDVWTITETVTGNINTRSTYKLGGNFFGTQEPDAYNLYIGKGSFNPPVSINAYLNTFLGIEAGKVNVSSLNTFVGAQAGLDNTTGNTNTFIGSNAGSGNISGADNVIVGVGVINLNSSQNVIIGSRIIPNATSASDSTLIGYSVASALSTGASNVLIGSNSGDILTTGANNTFIGTSTNGSALGTTGAIALGYGAVAGTKQFVVGSVAFPIDTMRINGSASTQCTITTGTGIACTSDERFKTNILDITNVLPSLTQVKTVTYNWVANPTSAKQIGFLAQDLEQYFPELVATDSDGYKSVYYSQMTPILVEAIRELNLKVQNISPLSSGGGTSIADYLANSADKFINGIVHVARLIVGSPEARTGITLYDEVTGEPYCLSVASGATKTTAGECSIITPVPIAVPENAPAPSESAPVGDLSITPDEPIDTTDPIIAPDPIIPVPDAPAPANP